MQPGTRFAERYEIVGLIGRGGMGMVYRARDLALQREVALKVLNARIAGELATRFEREARAIARLDHASCVRILDYGRTRYQFHYIAMELVDGTTLATLLRDGPMSSSRALTIARQVLAALAHAHAHGVLHRDVKPENVMVGQRAVLIDFGLAWLRDEPGLTGNGMCIGSPAYLAPERLRGEPYDASCDVYAVGVILYEMLAGARPFAGASPQHTMQLALHRPPRPLRGFRDDLSPALEAVVLRALAKQPSRRFADAEAMLSALDDVPVLDALVDVRARATRDEEVATESLVQIIQPSVWRRVWSRLRYGRWRWRES
jgi:serine/threonine-protein kinase